MSDRGAQFSAAVDAICAGEVFCSAVEVRRLWCGQVIGADGRLIFQTANVYATRDVAIGGMRHYVAIIRRAHTTTGALTERRPPGRAECYLRFGEAVNG